MAAFIHPHARPGSTKEFGEVTLHRSGWEDMDLEKLGATTSNYVLNTQRASSCAAHTSVLELGLMPIQIHPR